MDFETLMKCRQVSTEWCGHIDSFLWDRLSKTEDRPDKPFLPDLHQITDGEKRHHPRILLLIICTSNMEKRIQTARLYLRHARDKNPKGVRGYTPLHYFAWRGDIRLFELFFKEAEDKNPKEFINDRTPLHAAAGSGHLAICHMIVDKVEDKRPLDSSGKTWQGSGQEQTGRPSLICWNLLSPEFKIPRTRISQYKISFSTFNK